MHKYFTGWTTAGSKDDQLPNMQAEQHSVPETLPQMAAGSPAAPEAECDLAQARDATEENHESPIAATTPPSTLAKAAPIDIDKVVQELARNPQVCVCEPFCVHWEVHAKKVIERCLAGGGK